MFLLCNQISERNFFTAMSGRSYTLASLSPIYTKEIVGSCDQHKHIHSSLSSTKQIITESPKVPSMSFKWKVPKTTLAIHRATSILCDQPYTINPVFRRIRCTLSRPMRIRSCLPPDHSVYDYRCVLNVTHRASRKRMWSHRHGMLFRE